MSYEKKVAAKVVEERDELLDKIDELCEFVVSNPCFYDIPKSQQDLLRVQLSAMNVYASILDMRITDFNERLLGGSDD